MVVLCFNLLICNQYSPNSIYNSSLLPNTNLVKLGLEVYFMIHPSIYEALGSILELGQDLGVGRKTEGRKERWEAQRKKKSLSKLIMVLILRYSKAFYKYKINA